MSSKTNWHSRPVLAPVVYGVGTAAVGAYGFVFGYLLTDSIRYGLYAQLFLDILLVLFLVECARTAKEGDT